MTPRGASRADRGCATSKTAYCGRATVEVTRSRHEERGGDGMQSRIDYGKIAPGAVQAMLGLEGYVRQSGLDHALLDLIRTRASQLNGCAYCIDMHTKDARAIGESEQRLYALSAWRETPFFDPEERAALGLFEAVVRMSEDHVPDAAWAQAAAVLTERQMTALICLIVSINAWNAVGVST